MRFFLGTHVFTPLAALYLEMGWLDVKYVRWLDMIRLKNRINNMNTDRWPKKVWQHDRNTNTDAWFCDVQYILNLIGLTDPGLLESEVDIDYVHRELYQHSKQFWDLEATTKTKLEFFVNVHNKDSELTIATSNLTRVQRSYLIKLKSGVLPLKVETGRYKGTKRELRTCDLCDSKEIEDERHFLIHCRALKRVRKAYLKSEEIEWGDINKKDHIAVTKHVLSKNHIKFGAKWIEDMYNTRKNLLYR